jgi:hypothetical protein
MTISMKDSAFKPLKPQDKTDRTNAAAREIIDAEAAARQSKTERLRAARLKMEAERAEADAKPKAKPRAAAKRPKFIKA